MPASAISSAIFSDVSGVISAGFITMRVARRQRGRHLPAGEHQREVPRHDLADHAHRLAQRVVEEARLDRNRLALELVGHAAEVAVARRGARHVERARVAQRVAGVERLEPRQLFGIRLDQIGELEQDAAAVGRCQATPRREELLVAASTARSTSARAGHRDLGDRRVVVRVERGQRLAAQRIDETAVDEQLVADRRAQAGRLCDVCEAHARDSAGRREALISG